MSSSYIARESFKHITAITLEFSPLSSSTASRTMRVLLAGLPVKPWRGIEAPQIITKTVPVDSLQKLTVVYKNKTKLELDHKHVNSGLADLVRKIEAPAKAIRMKEEGL